MFGLLRSMCAALLSIPNSLMPFAPPARLVYQFPTGVLIENIACRPLGDLLLTSISGPTLYTMDPAASTPYAEIIHTFPNATSLTGIAEMATPDVFAVVSGNWSTSGYEGIPGSFFVWKVDFRSDPPAIDLITAVPGAVGINGLAVVRDGSGTILLADSALGTVWAINPNNGRPTPAITDDMFKPGPKTNFSLGINGINTRVDSRGRNVLHFTNSANQLYGTIQITPTGYAAGKATQLASLDLPERFDDFALDAQGSALLAVHSNAVYKIALDGSMTLYSKSDLIKQPTSTIFGRGTGKEQSTLYISTDGYPGGGQVIAIEDYAALAKSAKFRWARGGQQPLAVRKGDLK